jgi:hypothetical protein
VELQPVLSNSGFYTKHYEYNEPFPTGKHCPLPELIIRQVSKSDANHSQYVFYLLKEKKVFQITHLCPDAFSMFHLSKVILLIEPGLSTEQLPIDLEQISYFATISPEHEGRYRQEMKQCYIRSI